ncbi:hypothetical protein [Microcoleus sp. FACHB-672]|nr:hypothetical protein [Microcoleus sp. FACHB-672]
MLRSSFKFHLRTQINADGLFVGGEGLWVLRCLGYVRVLTGLGD